MRTPPTSPPSAPAPQPAASPASQPPPPPDVFPTRRPKGELRASAEDVADVISGAYDDAGTDDDEDVSFASVGVVRALRLPDASVGSVGPETSGGALEAAAYASLPLTEVNENFPKAGEGTDLNAFPKIRVPPNECFVDPDSDDEIVAQYVDTGTVDA